MSSYVAKVLMPHEQVIFAATLHWIMYLQGLAITIGGGMMAFCSRPVLILLFGERMGDAFTRPVCMVALIVVVVGSFLLLTTYLRQTSTEIVVTNKRLIAKYGFISFTTFEILVNRITGANYEQSVAGRVLGFGTVLVHGAGGEISPIDQVADPQLFYRALISVLRTQ